MYSIETSKIFHKIHRLFNFFLSLFGDRATIHLFWFKKRVQLKFRGTENCSVEVDIFTPNLCIFYLYLIKFIFLSWILFPAFFFTAFFTKGKQFFRIMTWQGGFQSLRGLALGKTVLVRTMWKSFQCKFSNGFLNFLIIFRL